MVITLAKLPTTLRGPDDPAYKGRVPIRALYLAPDAAVSLLSLEQDTGGLVYSDIYRNAEGSLRARRAKSGVQPPGYSPHNFGLAVDLDVTTTLKLRKWRYPDLVDVMADHGWHCHRRDLDSSASEHWHFSYFGLRAAERLKLADPDRRATWAAPAEAEIMDRYGSQFAMQPQQIRDALAIRGYRVDAGMGAAIKRFQHDWDLTPDGIAGPRTQRTLATATANLSVAA